MKSIRRFCITFFAAILIPRGFAQQQIPISSVTGLQNELDVLVPMGPGYVPSRVAMINSGGSLDAVAGNPGDCVHVDGSSGPCGGTTVTVETPGGATNGTNITFTLASTPSATQPVQVFKNGLLQSANIDYTLSGKTISFGSAPATGDLIRVCYTASLQQGKGVRLNSPDDVDLRKMALQALSRQSSSPAPENGSGARSTLIQAPGIPEDVSVPFRSIRILDRLIKQNQQSAPNGMDSLFEGTDVSRHPRKARGGTDATILRALGGAPLDAAPIVADDQEFDARTIIKSKATELPLRSIRQLKDRVGSALGF